MVVTISWYLLPSTKLLAAIEREIAVAEVTVSVVPATTAPVQAAPGASAPVHVFRETRVVVGVCKMLRKFDPVTVRTLGAPALVNAPVAADTVGTGLAPDV